MQIAEILSVERILCGVELESKKATLEALSKLLANQEPSLSHEEIFDCLLVREKLGSTDLGHGIAIPHGRMKSSKKTIAAFLQLRSGVDFDTGGDKALVDLLFALVVPENAAEEHLIILANLATMFQNNKLLQRLRKENTTDGIFKILTEKPTPSNSR